MPLTRQPRASRGRVVALITGRRSKFVVALAAIVLAGALASQAGKVVLTSDPVVLLPDGAESVQALRSIERFPSGDVTAAITVVAGDSGLRPGPRAAGRAAAGDRPGAAAGRGADLRAAAVGGRPRRRPRHRLRRRATRTRSCPPSTNCADAPARSSARACARTSRAARGSPPTSKGCSAGSTEPC